MAVDLEKTDRYIYLTYAIMVEVFTVTACPLRKWSRTWAPILLQSVQKKSYYWAILSAVKLPCNLPLSIRNRLKN
ncbi:hypothetical protein D3C72_2194740 [compost metagenome]